MPKRGDFEYLSDIEEAIKRIGRYTRSTDYSRLLKSTKTQDSVVRNLEIIGEAAKNISAGLRRKHKEIDWKGMAGLRDKLIHHYFGIDWEILWDVVKIELPGLRPKLEKILKEMRKKQGH